MFFVEVMTILLKKGLEYFLEIVDVFKYKNSATALRSTNYFVVFAEDCIFVAN